MCLSLCCVQEGWHCWARLGFFGLPVTALPATTIKRVSLQEPSTRVLPLVVAFSVVCLFIGKEQVAKGCREQGGSDLRKEIATPRLVFPVSC